ncbi:hypothetical protein E5676_scaffold139G00100 [Cucumis melo var. makuwa]|uniref:Uncharacterized protein n=2 Tax=Cucumis melo TaxID=3656 RepID=A0A5A7UC85_CUCMM|nr:hypothetical protein E6C27_scaffold344G00100 [Cucumis melo var. makuwa]TYK11358.1 hypothetical protein E5676_scaffold139G00100 [Cucumis melo var. makuwa]
MDPITYERIRRRPRRSCRGFRLTSRRLSVSKLQSKFGWLLRILNWWRRSIVDIKKRGRSSKGSSNSGAQATRLRSFRRSNSFYAEAIADCLDFIKTSSSSFSTPPSTIPTHTF